MDCPLCGTPIDRGRVTEHLDCGLIDMDQDGTTLCLCGEVIPGGTKNAKTFGQRLYDHITTAHDWDKLVTRRTMEEM